MRGGEEEATREATERSQSNGQLRRGRRAVRADGQWGDWGAGHFQVSETLTY